MYEVDVEYVAVGTGAALQLGRSGDVDALIVHAPQQEMEFIEEGYGLERIPVAYNAFVCFLQFILKALFLTHLKRLRRVNIALCQEEIIQDARQRTSHLESSEFYQDWNL